MPGIFGAVGIDPMIRDGLWREFMLRWPDAVAEQAGAILLGGHAYGDAQPVYRVDEGHLVGIDGEWALYLETAERITRGIAGLGSAGPNGFAPTVASVGNLAIVDPRSDGVYLTVDPSGTFPLYYVEYDDGLLFCSLLRPLARVTNARLHDLAILEFLRQAYTVDGKTVFSRVRRLLPGQALTYRSGQGLQLHEQSEAWAGEVDGSDARAAAESAWERLRASLQRAASPRTALMMSGGWDSRTLLAGANVEGLTCYSHGDTESRELGIVRRLCAAAGVPCSLEPIDDRVLDLDLLSRGFARSENVVFPHWHRAGAILVEQGVRCIMAGVFGEILGGHYGPTMLAAPSGKVRSLATTLLGFEFLAGNRVTPKDYLRTPPLGRHWYLSRDYEASIERPRERLDAAIEAAVHRLQRRGVPDDITLVEAFISEHRGTQYINAQLLSCRAHTDIALPFAGRELFGFSTRVPLTVKIHNSLNRRILRRHAPHLLREPMAATLVPASWPILAQEVSRVGRKACEEGIKALARRAGRPGRHPRLGWVNFAFLGKSQGIRQVVADLRSDIWDRDAINKRLDGLARTQDIAAHHPIFDQLSKVYTVDRLIRRG